MNELTATSVLPLRPAQMKLIRVLIVKYVFKGVTMAFLMNHTEIIDLLSVITGLLGLVPSVRRRMCELCKATRDALATIARVRQQVCLNS